MSLRRTLVILGFATGLALCGLGCDKAAEDWQRCEDLAAGRSTKAAIDACESAVQKGPQSKAAQMAAKKLELLKEQLRREDVAKAAEAARAEKAAADEAERAGRLAVAQKVVRLIPDSDTVEITYHHSENYCSGRAKCNACVEMDTTATSNGPWKASGELWDECITIAGALGCTRYLKTAWFCCPR
jgi:hypothetical protein